MKKNVFISYNHDGETKGTISKLSSDLEKLGLKVWLDQNEIKPGESISTAIANGLEQASHVLAVVGPNDKQSAWATKELEMAKAQGKPIIPLMVNSATVKDLPESIADFLAVDASSQEGLRAVYEVFDSQRSPWSRLKEYIVNG